MKLKTLKDLPFVKRAIGGENIRKELKAEAIKWRNNVPQLWEEWYVEYFKKKTTTKIFGEWLLDKLFNITEEDLK